MWGTAFGWLASLMETFGSLIPVYYHHEWVDVAVSIKRGKYIKVLEYGINWYWPFWTSVYHRAANKQTKRLPSQTLTTKDCKNVTVGGVIRYHIEREEKESIILCLVETDDVDRVIVDECLAVFCEYITSNTYESLCGDRRTINTEITRACRSALKQCGIYVERAQLTNFTTCLTLAIVKPETGYGDNTEEVEE